MFSRVQSAETPRADPVAHPAEDPLEASLARSGTSMSGLGEDIAALLHQFGALLQHTGAQKRAGSEFFGCGGVPRVAPYPISCNFSPIFLRFCMLFRGKFQAKPENWKG